MQPEAHSSLSSADVETFPAQLAVVLQQNASQSEVINQLSEEISRLQAKLESKDKQLAEALRLLFGSRSERYVLGPEALQGLLFDDMEVEVPLPPEPETDQPKRKRRKAKRRPDFEDLPDHLPRETIVIQPEEDTTGLICIGMEKTQYLESVPSMIKVVEIHRPKYVDPTDVDSGVIIAELPPRLVDKGMAGPGLLADVMVNKYCDHLPLYRQQQRFRREGIEIATSTLGGWIAQSAWHLGPLYDALKQEALLSGYLQADETRIQVQDRKKKGKTHRGFYWVYHTPEQKLFVMEYRKSRARAGPVAFLGGYAGALQTDGYVAYNVFEAHPSMTVYGCMAHAWRKFYDCRSYEPEKAEHVLTKIRRLYAIERRLREEGASAERLREVRQEEARPVLEALKPWLEANGGLPKSPWGQATNYTLGLWKRLSRYLDEGRVELDNNLIENALRPLVIGRKNYLFAGSHDAAQRAAVVYSLLGTCKLHGVNPQEWLTDVFERIPTHPARRVADLLPHHWQKARQADKHKAA